uniref:DNA maturase B n=1 Tax=uncultured marine virus TaxID=186617 RepID=A0A0F7LB10_9VIRU|nr:DNA maturase B [uncultured marine virus]
MRNKELTVKHLNNSVSCFILSSTTRVNGHNRTCIWNHIPYSLSWFMIPVPT